MTQILFSGVACTAEAIQKKGDYQLSYEHKTGTGQTINRFEWFASPQERDRRFYQIQKIVEDQRKRIMGLD